MLAGNFLKALKMSPAVSNKNTHDKQKIKILLSGDADK